MYEKLSEEFARNTAIAWSIAFLVVLFIENIMEYIL
jgi:hypothetical protein